MSSFFVGMLLVAGLLQAETEQVPCLDWSLQTGGAKDDGMSIWAMAMLGHDRIVVTGDILQEVSSNKGNHDIFVMAIDAITGGPRWTVQRGASDFDLSHAIAVDQAGNIVIAGETRGSLDGQTYGGDFDLFVMKFSSSGKWEWTYQTGTSESEWASDVAVNAQGEIFVSALGTSTHLMKLAPSGSLSWAVRNETDWIVGASALALNPDGDIILGYATRKDGIALRKFFANSTESWSFRRGTRSAHVQSIAVDGSGNIAIAANVRESMDDWPWKGKDKLVPDSLVMRIRADGTWIETYQYGSANWDEARGVAVNKDGDIIVSGAMDDFHTLYVMKLKGNDPVWTFEKVSPPDGEQAAAAVVIDEAGNIYFGGFTNSSLDGFTMMGIYDIYAGRLLDEPCHTTASRASKGNQADNIVNAVLTHGVVAAMLVLLHG